MQRQIIEKPIFSARLTPHRSLGKAGFWLLMGFIAFSCLSSGVLFLSIGAWPIFLFMVLDMVLIWGAFKLNYRDGRIYEEVVVWRHKIEFRKINSNGSIKTYEFNPFWVKFQINRHNEIGITAMQIIEKGKQVDIGSFLNPLDRDSFADAFNLALIKAKSG